MITQTCEIDVRRPLDAVYRALADATLWSRLTPSRHRDHRYEVRLRDGQRDVVFVYPPGHTDAKHVMLRTLAPPREVHVAYLRYPWPVRDFQAVWSLAPSPAGTRVTLHYRMRIGVPFAGDWVGRRVVLPFFYGTRTQSMLAEFAAQVEAGAAADMPATMRAVG